MRRSLILVLALTLAGCGGAAAPTASLTDLASVSALEAEFDAAAGKPRLVLVFSPT